MDGYGECVGRKGRGAGSVGGDGVGGLSCVAAGGRSGKRCGGGWRRGYLHGECESVCKGAGNEAGDGGKGHMMGGKRIANIIVHLRVVAACLR